MEATNAQTTSASKNTDSKLLPMVENKLARNQAKGPELRPGMGRASIDLKNRIHVSAPG